MIKINSKLIGLTCLALALSSCGEPKPDKNYAADLERDASQDTKAKLKEEAHAAVRNKLKDPESAQFKDDQIQTFPDAGIVCGGQVNSKNSYGGYTGYQNYWYSRELGAATEEDGLDVWQPLSEKCRASLQKETAEIEKNTAKMHKETERLRKNELVFAGDKRPAPKPNPIEEEANAAIAKADAAIAAAEADNALENPTE